MNTHETLVKARGRIQRKKDWAPDTASWGGDVNRACAALAITFSAPSAAVHKEAYRVLLAGVGIEWLPHCGGSQVIRFNDTHSHAEVLQAFDKAIAATAPEPDTSFLNEVRVEEPVAS